MAKVKEQEAALKALVAAGSATAKSGFTAGKAIRNMDLGDPYEVGDEIVIPKKEDFVVGEALIGPKPEAGKKDTRTKAEFLMANHTKTSTGVTKPIQVYPNSFAKVVYEVDDNGARTSNKVKTSGTAATLYATGIDTADGMTKLAGKTIVISAVTPVKQVAFGIENPTASDVKTTYVYTYDIKK